MWAWAWAWAWAWGGGRHYAKAEDHVSVVRVHCGRGRYPEAEEAVVESNRRGPGN